MDGELELLLCMNSILLLILHKFNKKKIYRHQTYRMVYDVVFFLYNLVSEMLSVGEDEKWERFHNIIQYVNGWILTLQQGYYFETVMATTQIWEQLLIYRGYNQCDFVFIYLLLHTDHNHLFMCIHLSLLSSNQCLVKWQKVAINGRFWLFNVGSSKT